MAIAFLPACTGYLFYPDRQWLPHDEAVARHERFFIPVESDVQLSALRIRHSGPVLKGAILYFHGNAGNISKPGQPLDWLAEAGYDVVLVDYRGYGLSPGKPDLEQNLRDIPLVVTSFAAAYPDMPRYVIAHSLGASMAGYVLAVHPEAKQAFAAVVLDAGFAGYRRIMRDAMSHNWPMWLMRYPASLGMPADHDLLDVIDHISPTPLMIIHGSDDAIVPYCHGLDLYEAAVMPKVFLGYEGGHNEAFDDPVRQGQVLEFLSAHR